MSLQKDFELAVSHHQAGRLADAEKIIRDILAREPNHAPSIHLLGTLAHLVGQNEAALQLMDRSIALSPASAAFHVNRAVVLDRLGRIDEAIVAYRHAIMLAPALPEAYFNLGELLIRVYRLHEAETCFLQALKLRPHYAQANHNLGTYYYRQNNLDLAMTHYHRAIEQQPNYPQACNHLGNAYFDRQLFQQAAQYFQRALQLQPTFADAYNNLGRISVRQNRLEEAEHLFVSALNLQPGNAEAMNNLANVMYRRCRLEDSIDLSRRAIAVRPDMASAHWNLGLSLLCKGQFTEGWREYAWRTGVDQLHGTCRQFARPQWDGSDLAGRRILLHAEQGFGDTLQFVRYLPMVQQRGGKIIFDCRKELIPLLQANFSIEQWVISEEKIPEFDVHCPLLSLPMVLQTTLENIPADVPYLRAPGALQERWSARLQVFTGLKIGISWAGLAMHTNDRERSISPEALGPLATSVNATFFSLQMGRQAAQSQSPPGGMKLIDWTGEIQNFADSAALIANLDLIITVDTAVAHLAGAMGKAVWVLLPFSPDWRWMLHREDSPWYPTMRLFRQPAPGDWATPIARAAKSLADFGGRT